MIQKAQCKIFLFRDGGGGESINYAIRLSGAFELLFGEGRTQFCKKPNAKTKLKIQTVKFPSIQQLLGIVLRPCILGFSNFA